MSKGYFSRAIAAALVLIMHSALLIGGHEKSERSVRKVTLIGDPPSEFVPLAEGDGSGPQCDRRYRGVGLQHSASWRVVDVGYGYPAHEAGVKVGDQIIGGWPEPDESGRVTFTVERNGERITMRVRTVEVCLREGR